MEVITRFPSDDDASTASENGEFELPPKYSNVPTPLPVSFIPTPTRAFREHRKRLKALVQPGLPRSAVLAAGPAPVPIPIPIPVPALPGARVLMWKQDPSVGEIGIRKAYLPNHVFAGPSDSRVRIEGLPAVVPNAFGDLIATPGTEAFDAIHTFAVVRETLTMYQRARGGAVMPWQWNSGGNTDALQVFPHAGVTMNAYYSRDEKG